MAEELEIENLFSVKGKVAVVTGEREPTGEFFLKMCFWIPKSHCASIKISLDHFFVFTAQFLRHYALFWYTNCAISHVMTSTEQAKILGFV